MAALTVFLAAAGYMAPMVSRPVASRAAVSMQMNKKARSLHAAGLRTACGRQTFPEPIQQQ
jgi:hypothetical protein